MKVLRSLAVSMALTVAGSGACAQAINDDTQCGAIAALTQYSPAGETRAKEAASYIEETMRALDRLHGRRGKGEIFPQMTEEGRTSLVQTVIMRCHDRRAVTVADTAIETYEAVRRARISLGLFAAARDTAWTRYSRTDAPRQFSALRSGKRPSWEEY